MKRVNVFVYGTLRKGCSNHYLMREDDNRSITTQYIGTGKVKGKMYNVGFYPKVVLCEGDNQFVVEAYEISKDTEKVLDNLELPYGYKKSTISVDIVDDNGITHALEGIIYHVLPEEHILREETILEDWNKRYH